MPAAALALLVALAVTTAPVPSLAQADRDAAVAPTPAPPAPGAAEPYAPSPPVPEPSDYRMTDFRAAVPATLAGARVVDTDAAAALWRDGRARFVDTLPRPPRPTLPQGTLWRAPKRDNIPGSVWLVNTGFGTLSPEAEAYFGAGIERATGGDRAVPLVFYCLSDCWMSWNAAKRAIAAGWGAVYWYPYGTDGWAAAGLPLEPAEPEPGEPLLPGQTN